MNPLLPVTLIGGFLGAGKTSLLHHFISEHAAGPLAIFVEGAGGSSLDAKAVRGLCGAMRRTRDTVWEIPAVEETAQIDWLARRLQELNAKAEAGRVLIEVSGTTNAPRLGRHFGLLSGHPNLLATAAKLERIICVIDALDFQLGLRGSPQPMASPLVDLQRAQIAGASLLVLNKCDLLEEAWRVACIESLRQLNPQAALVETAYGELPAKIWSQPDSIEQLGLAVEYRANPESPAAGSGDRDADNIELGSVLYGVHRPFHPGRFWDWFEAEHPGLLRVKGLVWLATRNLLVGGISRTRWQSSCGGAGIWWAALPREEWPSEREALERMQETWREPWGDRRQELSLVGEARALPEIMRGLAACLLNDAEFARPPRDWLAFPDPFPAWDVGGES